MAGGVCGLNNIMKTRMHSSRMRTERLHIVLGGGRCCDLVPGGCCDLVPGGGRCCDLVRGGRCCDLWCCPPPPTAIEQSE